MENIDDLQISKIIEKKKRTPGIKKRMKNLKPFKPGEVANPNGRPVGTISLTSIIKRKLLEIYNSPKNKEDKKIAIELLADQIIKNSIENGSERTQEKIWAYLDGHPRQTVDIGADKDSLGDLTTFFRAITKKKK